MIAHRLGEGAKIVFVNEFGRDLVVCLIIPGKLLPKMLFASFVCCSLGAAHPFLVARASRSGSYS